MLGYETVMTDLNYEPSTNSPPFLDCRGSKSLGAALILV